MRRPNISVPPLGNFEIHQTILLNSETTAQALSRMPTCSRASSKGQKWPGPEILGGWKAISSAYLDH